MVYNTVFSRLNQTIDNLQTISWCKDATLSMSAITEYAIKRFSLGSKKDVLGKTDFDLPWSKFASDIRRIDKIILTGKQKTIIHPTITAKNEFLIVVSQRYPVHHKGKIVGIHGSAIEMPKNQCNFGFLTMLYQDHKVWGSNIRYYELLKNTEKLEKYKITKKEFICLFYLLRGKTARDIADILCLSSRTIEHYIDKLKIKLNCKNKSELIEKTISLELNAVIL